MSYVLCLMSYVLCLMSDALCLFSYVLCLMSYVLCLRSWCLVVLFSYVLCFMPNVKGLMSFVLCLVSYLLQTMRLAQLDLLIFWMLAVLQGSIRLISRIQRIPALCSPAEKWHWVMTPCKTVSKPPLVGFKLIYKFQMGKQKRDRPKKERQTKDRRTEKHSFA